MLAECRLGHMQRSSGNGEVHRVGELDKLPDFLQFHPPDLSLFPKALVEIVPRDDAVFGVCDADRRICPGILPCAPSGVGDANLLAIPNRYGR